MARLNEESALSPLQPNAHANPNPNPNANGHARTSKAKITKVYGRQRGRQHLNQNPATKTALPSLQLAIHEDEGEDEKQEQDAEMEMGDNVDGDAELPDTDAEGQIEAAEGTPEADSSVDEHLDMQMETEIQEHREVGIKASTPLSDEHPDKGLVNTEEKGESGPLPTIVSSKSKAEEAEEDADQVKKRGRGRPPGGKKTKASSSSSAIKEAEEDAEPPKKRGRGRPSGSKNIKSKHQKLSKGKLSSTTQKQEQAEEGAEENEAGAEHAVVEFLATSYKRFDDGPLEKALLARWAGFPLAKDLTWEPERTMLEDAPELVRAFYTGCELDLMLEDEKKAEPWEANGRILGQIKNWSPTDPLEARASTSEVRSRCL